MPSTAKLPDVPWPERYKRNVEIVEAFADGGSLHQIAERFDTSHVNVHRILRSAGIDTSMNRSRGRSRAARNKQRDEQIADAYAKGASLAALSERFDLSFQRIHQIATKKGDRFEDDEDRSDSATPR